MKDYSVIKEELMDAMVMNLEEAYDYGYDHGYTDAKNELGQNAIDLAHEESNRAYQQGLEDAWEAAKKIKRMDIAERDAIFAEIGKSTYSIIMSMPASEVIAKIKEYEDKQKQDTEMKVGDEVYLLDENHPRVVTNVFDDGGRTRAVQISENGKWVVDDVKELHRTGKHFDQIAEVLKEMRGESK